MFQKTFGTKSTLFLNLWEVKWKSTSWEYLSANIQISTKPMLIFFAKFILLQLNHNFLVPMRSGTIWKEMHDTANLCVSSSYLMQKHYFPHFSVPASSRKANYHVANPKFVALLCNKNRFKRKCTQNTQDKEFILWSRLTAELLLRIEKKKNQTNSTQLYRNQIYLSQRKTLHLYRHFYTTAAFLPKLPKTLFLQ